jgi:hypothetical protein
MPAPWGLGDPQPVEGQQRDQGVLGGGPSGDRQGADLIAVQADAVGLLRPRQADNLYPPGSQPAHGRPRADSALLRSGGWVRLDE